MHGRGSEKWNYCYVVKVKLHLMMEIYNESTNGDVNSMSTFSGTFIFNERDHILSWIATAEHVIDRCGLSIELLVGNKATNLKKSWQMWLHSCNFTSL